MPHSVHAKTQLNIRFPPELIARVKDAAKRYGLTQADIVKRGTEAELDRLDGPQKRSAEPSEASSDE